MPRDREKNIWPPAVDSTEKKSGVSLMTAVGQCPAGDEHVLQAFHCAVQGAGADDADDQQDEQGGMPTEQTFSMPPPTPPITMTMVMATKIRP